jgi:hypothetical protein
LNKLVIIVSVLVMASVVVGWSLVGPIFDHRSNQITVAGSLKPGLGAGCVMLEADDGTQYLLTGSTNYPAFGSRVSVTGYLEKNVASYCMQGKQVVHVLSISITTVSNIGYATATASSAAVTNGSTQQSSTISGVPITASGFIYTVVESPHCYPQCLAPSFFLTYLYVPPGNECTGTMECYPPPQNYRLLNSDGSPFLPTAPNGTHVGQLTGLLVTPSSWSCGSFYVPKICMLGDIYVQSVEWTASVG